jgi:hypothetical protein
VRTVFFIDSIMRLSPEACRRTLVRSRGLVRRKDKALEYEGEWGPWEAYCVMDAAIVAATPSG